MSGSPDGKRWDVITFGDVFVDLVMTGFPRWPEPGEEVVAESLVREVGGGAAITACALAVLGSSVALVATIGGDGDWFSDRVAGLGVDLGPLHVNRRESTAVTVAVSTAADRSFFTYRGANAGLPGLLASTRTIETLTLARHVHLASAIAPGQLIDLARQLHQAGTTLSLDVGWVEPWLRNGESLVALREVDLFLPNEREGVEMTGATEPEAVLRRFAAAGVPRVVLKLGAAGSMMLAGDRLIREDPPEVEAVDTTGAGDCFDAGFISAWIAGEPPATCLRAGNTCGALSTTDRGGLAWIQAAPGRDRLKRAGIIRGLI